MSAPVAQRRRPQATAAAQVPPPAAAAPVQQPAAQPTTPRRRATTTPATQVAQPATPAPVAEHTPPRQFAPSNDAAALVAKPPGGSAMAMFQPGPSTPLVPLVSSMSSSPYVIFMHPQVKIFTQIIAALGALSEGETVLIQPDGNAFIHLPNMAFILTPKYGQFYADYSGDGSMNDAVPIERAEGIPRKPNGDKYTDTVAAVVIAVDIFDDGAEFYPCRIEFRGPKCPAVHAAVNANIAANDPNWPAFNEDNKIIASSGLPAFCYQLHETTITGGNQPKDTSRGQKPYVTADSQARNLTVGEAKALLSKLSDPEFMKVIQDCMDDHDKRMAEVNAIYNRPQA